MSYLCIYLYQGMNISTKIFRQKVFKMLCILRKTERIEIDRHKHNYLQMKCLRVQNARFDRYGRNITKENKNKYVKIVKSIKELKKFYKIEKQYEIEIENEYKKFHKKDICLSGYKCINHNVTRKNTNKFCVYLENKCKIRYKNRDNYMNKHKHLIYFDKQEHEMSYLEYIDIFRANNILTDNVVVQNKIKLKYKNRHRARNKDIFIIFKEYYTTNLFRNSSQTDFNDLGISKIQKRY